jgi:hypothetical protein
MSAVAGALPAAAVDGKAWARTLIARWQAGGRVSPTAVRFAHEALGLPIPRGCR